MKDSSHVRKRGNYTQSGIMKWWQEALMWTGIAGLILAVLMIAWRMLKRG